MNKNYMTIPIDAGGKAFDKMEHLFIIKPSINWV